MAAIVNVYLNEHLVTLCQQGLSGWWWSWGLVVTYCLLSYYTGRT